MLAPFASHVPFLYDRAAGVLHCHLARGNPQWRHFESSLEALAAKFEQGRAAPWVPNYDRRRLAGSVGVETRVRAIEGKFKLSQNRSAADRAGVVAQLRASGTDSDAALAALMVAAGPR